MKSQTIIQILLLSLILPFLGGIESYTAALLLSLLGINIVYVLLSVAASFIFHFLDTEYQLLLIFHGIMIVVYLTFFYFFLKEEFWMSTSVIIPELLCFHQYKKNK